MIHLMVRSILSVILFRIGKNRECPIIFLDFDGVLSTDNYLDPLRAAKSKTSDYWLDFLYQFDFTPSDTVVFLAKIYHNRPMR